MSKGKARVFVPLTKVDEEQRLVYGRITEEMLDKANEVMDYDSSKPNFEAWSNEIHTASGGLSKGNVRVMHGLSVAGKLTDLDFNDGEKAIDVCAKVVDDGEWEKVKEGCYTGFSVGGSYAKRWTEDDGKGGKIKKFTAKPNEVSLVDNPCVPSATFALVKADGAEEEIAFKLAKTEETLEEKTEETPATESTYIPTNDEVVAKAEEMAKAANDGTTWMTHVEAAREELIKNAPANSGEAQKETEEGGNAKAEDKGEAENDADKSGDEAAGDEADDKSTKITPAGVKQGWTASDGKFFEKKDEAVAHEATLAKGEPTEIDKLKHRLEKALNPEEEAAAATIWDDWDRLGKAVQALETPFDAEANAPKLEKGMYTVSRFANTLWDMGSLTRSIKAEGKREGDDEADSAVAAEMQKALSVFANSFKTYVNDQVTELLAGIDDELCVATYDYYYAAAQADPENTLAKDVCGLIQEFREPSRELRETLSKAFGAVESASDEDEELPPPLQKKLDKALADNEELKKIATDAVDAVEELKKRMEKVEETPLPRAPRNIAHREGDLTVMGKNFKDADAAKAYLHDMIKTEGPDAVALAMIKASQASGGQQIHLPDRS